MKLLTASIAFLLALQKYGVKADFCETLVKGDNSGTVKPGALTAALAAAAPYMQPSWQNIATAPKDGTVFAGYFEDNGKVRPCWWSDKYFKKYGHGWVIGYTPTYKSVVYRSPSLWTTFPILPNHGGHQNG